MRGRRLLFLLPLGAFAALALYFALALRPDADPHALPSALIDPAAPPFTLPDLQGREWRSATEFSEKLVLVNFFASWCVPCREDHPLLLRLAGREHIPIYGIAYKDRSEDSARFLDQLGNPFTLVGVDRKGEVGIDWGVYGVPETFLIDRAGHIRYRHVGPLGSEVLEHELLPLLAALNHP